MNTRTPEEWPIPEPWQWPAELTLYVEAFFRRNCK